MRVLIADDDPDGADILGLLFEDAGCDVRVVNNGFEAIAVSPTFSPQLIVLDLGMPGMDGFETARRLRNEAASKDAVYVAYTALPRSTVVEQLQGSPFAFFVQKPSDFDRFEKILDCCRPPREDAPVNRTRPSIMRISGAVAP
jgi:CheY-like chemotaxis protein